MNPIKQSPSLLTVQLSSSCEDNSHLIPTSVQIPVTSFLIDKVSSLFFACIEAKALEISFYFDEYTFLNSDAVEYGTSNIENECLDFSRGKVIIRYDGDIKCEFIANDNSVITSESLNIKDLLEDDVLVD